GEFRVAVLTRAATGLYRRGILSLTGGGPGAGGGGGGGGGRAANPPRGAAPPPRAVPDFAPPAPPAPRGGRFRRGGARPGSAWRTRQFEYQWLRALSGHYADFWQITEEALVFAARSLRLELTAESRARLMQAYLGLKAWPDVPASLRSLKEAGLRLAFLSN